MRPLLSIELKSRREARGLSQAEAASKICVDRDTLSRWERGTSKPTGVRTIDKLKVEYLVTQKELDDWFREWEMRSQDQEKNYYIRGFEFLSAKNMDEEDLLERLIEIDIDSVPRLLLPDEGTVEQWAPFFWRIRGPGRF